MRHLLKGIISAGLISTACAPSSIPVQGLAPDVQRYVAPSRATVRASTEQAHAPRIGHTVYVENTSTVPITVYSVTLRNCENVRGLCDAPTPISVVVKPGRREVIRRIDPRDEGMGFFYRLSWAWRPESRDSTIAGVLADEAPAGLGPPAVIPRSGAPPVRSAEGYLSEDEVRAYAGAGATLRTEPDTITMRVGETRSVRDVNVILYDSAGVRRGRIQYGMRFPPNKLSFVPPNIMATAPGEVTLEFFVPPARLAGIATPLPSAFLVVVIRE